MDYKKILCKLIDQFPEDDYREWVFEASNKSSGYRPHYGIVKVGGWHAVSGINVDCPIEDDWHKINPYKFSNIISAFVSFACPANVEKLLDENADLVAALEKTKLFLEHGPEFPYHLLADAEDLQEVVRQALAQVKEE